MSAQRPAFVLRSAGAAALALLLTCSNLGSGDLPAPWSHQPPLAMLPPLEHPDGSRQPDPQRPADGAEARPRTERHRLVDLNFDWDARAEFNLVAARIEIDAGALRLPRPPGRMMREVIGAMLRSADAIASGTPDGAHARDDSPALDPLDRAAPRGALPAPAGGGLGLFTSPAANLYIGLGWYDAATDDGVGSGRRGPKTVHEEELSDEHVLIGEAGLTWALGGARRAGLGRIAAGGWYHAGEFDRHYLGEKERLGGVYILLEQQLWRPTTMASELRGMSFFLQLGREEDLRAAPSPQQSLSAGLAWRGALAGRDADSAGISLWLDQPVNPLHPGDESDRAAVELFYRIQVTPAFTLRPDLQILLEDPGARADDEPPGVVASFRAQIAF
jgi:hypothetical protein